MQISRPYTAHERELIDKALKTIPITQLPDALNYEPVRPFSAVAAATQRNATTVYSKAQVRRADS